MTVALLTFLASTLVSHAEEPVPAPAPAAAPAPPAPAAADYKLNSSGSTLYVVVLKDTSTLGSGFAHDHTVGATGWTGTVHWDPANPAACKIDISVPVSGLRVDLPGYRTKAGLDPQEVSDEDKATISGNFQSKGQLDMAEFPAITFSSTSCTAGSTAGKYTVSGNMTMRGKARPTTVTMSITADGSTFKASGRFDAMHTDWGFNPFSAALGAVKNQNKLTFVIDVVGTKM